MSTTETGQAELAEVERTSTTLCGVAREAGDVAVRVGRINEPLTEYTRALWRAVEGLRAAWNAAKAAGVAGQARPIVAGAVDAMVVAVGRVQDAMRPAAEAKSRLGDCERAFDRIEEG